MRGFMIALTAMLFAIGTSTAMADPNSDAKADDKAAAVDESDKAEAPDKVDEDAAEEPAEEGKEPHQKDCTGLEGDKFDKCEQANQALIDANAKGVEKNDAKAKAKATRSNTNRMEAEATDE